MILLARALVCLILFAAPIFWFVSRSKQENAGLAMLVPLFGAIPAIVGAFCVFAPIEYLHDARQLSYLKDVAVPISGGLLVFIFSAVIAPRVLPRLLKDRQGLPGLILWIFLGVIWGAIWRLTDWLAQFAGFGTNG